ncbi:MAG: integral rane sensor signal transduction histidine kinase [Polaromonas sp.]|nr:integral rane sensor signal transduction histidine kinase [Polaromonas sp.]
MKLPAFFWRPAAAKMAGAWEAEPAQGSFERLWLMFMHARVAIAAVLVVLQAALQALGNIPNQWTLLVCIAYLCATLVVRFWGHPRPHRSSLDAQWVLTIGVDVVAFSLLNFFQASGINYTPLFALPVLLASVLGPILLALGTAASVTLLLLADAAWISMHGAGEFSARFLQAGLSGSGFFLVSLLANQLALRLAQEEKLVKTNQSAARMQIKVNEVVIASLADGVLVMDVNGIVRSINPAARRLLATQNMPCHAPFRLAAQAAWQPLSELMQQTFALQSEQQANISLVHPGLNARRLHVRSRLTDPQDALRESLCVMFLEDLLEMEARLRIQKMAAMGRMSAAVAHEIRNPLAAISQANALLEEDLHDAGQRQLTGMIGQNALRLAKIVDEVLDISRAQQQIPAPQTTTLRLDETARRIAADWARQSAASGCLRISTDTGNTAVYFDDEHLRRLMVNLLDNALRYASGSVHAIEVSSHLVAPGQARLAVWSDGQPLEDTVQAHLFEPFFSSESRSSGLGLYICRELCERYGALIGYQRVLRENTEGNEFFVMFRPASQFLSAELPELDAVLA